MEKNQAILYGIIGLLAGTLLGIWIATYSVNNEMTGMMKLMSGGMMGNTSTGMNMSMNGMMNEMSTVTGTERDEQFLRMMIVHHQGAIAMAESVKETTDRDELKTMADDIIAAQSAEIDQMKQWLKEWFDVDVSLETPAGMSTALHQSHHQS